jgi:DNA gyrase/topoisomerase IV subunit A
VRFVLYIEPDYYEDIKADTAEFEKRFKLTSSWRLSNMTCFDTNMRIVKYSTIGDILEAFFEPRLEAYERRRLNEMARLERDALEADAKARFLRAVLDGTLDLRRASDEDIVAAMKHHALPPLSQPSSPDTIDAYDYLLRLRMDRVKAKAIQDAEMAVIAARTAYETLRDTTASALWLQDLEDFESAWDIMQMVRQHAGSTGGAKKKRVMPAKPKAR